MFRSSSFTDPRIISKEIEKGEALIVDVRRDDEWMSGHARNAVHLSVERIMEGEVPTKDKSKKIYLYCASGNRSGIAANLLEKRGYDTTNIGGFSHWQAAGGPTED